MKYRFLIFCLANTGLAFAESRHFRLDVHASHIRWTLTGNVHTVHGTFRLKSGDLVLDPLSGAVSGEIVVDAASGESGSASRDQRMQNDVLETDQYPTIVLKLIKLETPIPVANDDSARLHGEFTLHGTTHEISIPLAITVSADAITGTGKFAVPYVAWGLKDPSNFLFKVNKTVEIEIEIAGHLAR